jgi:HD superfamily phosphohydrolase
MVAKDLEVIRDPLWDNIRLDRPALLALDTAAVQRLRYVRQVGHAFLVYPGATHTRFEHALGAYHLTRRALASLEERGELDRVPEAECLAVRLAALLHDIGHYPFSHALEEAGFPSHEQLGVAKLDQGELGQVLAAIGGAGFSAALGSLIRGRSASALQGLISGSLDLDKIEYLKRDALMCGVPYGEIDVDRLLNSLVLVDEPESNRRVIGVLEKGLSALESLLFAKYQMYRNVYWHHAVRSATAMYKRLVDEALAAGDVDARALSTFDDEGLLHRLSRRGQPPLLSALRERRLYKRVLECPAAELSGEALEWIADDRALTTETEDRLAAELGLSPGELLVDFPTKTQMLGLDLPVVRRSGEVRRLTMTGLEGAINLPVLSEQLYQSARWLRVFAVRRIDVPRGELIERLVAIGNRE